MHKKNLRGVIILDIYFLFVNTYFSIAICIGVQQLFISYYKRNKLNMFYINTTDFKSTALQWNFPLKWDFDLFIFAYLSPRGSQHQYNQVRGRIMDSATYLCMSVNEFSVKKAKYQSFSENKLINFHIRSNLGILNQSNGILKCCQNGVLALIFGCTFVVSFMLSNTSAD